MITVADVIALALPERTSVVAGTAGLGREVTWATRLRPSPPAFGHLGGGELVLLGAQTLELLDERLTLEAAVRQLADLGVAAVAHAGTVAKAARVAADETGVPLLQLPKDAELGPLEREASRLITERRRALQRRAQDVGRRLMELAIAGEPLGGTVREVAELAGRPAALEGRDGRLLA
ncbi:MAG: PucR family transcriptional regulator ligand-binding domain-containing protein, partial [Chloroflexota bacterium]|nr:PucR family transcriptional regulator ligand-binding domain-containing protein [Chloroflexota bacterium]